MKCSLALDLLSLAVALVLTVSCRFQSSGLLSSLWFTGKGKGRCQAIPGTVSETKGRERKTSSVLFLWDSVWGQKLKQKLLYVTHNPHLKMACPGPEFISNTVCGTEGYWATSGNSWGRFSAVVSLSLMLYWKKKAADLSFWGGCLPPCVESAEARLARIRCLELGGRGARGIRSVRDHNELKSSHSFIFEVLERLSASFHF